MSTAIRVCALLLGLSTTLCAGSLRVEFLRLAAQAHAKIVLDRTVRGPAPEGAWFEPGDPLERIHALAHATGFVVVEAHPGPDLTTLMVSPDPRGVRPITGEGDPRWEKSPDLVSFRAAPIQVDAMVVSVSPGILAELAAVGNELPPVPGHPNDGHQFLDGVGPGLKMLAFDRVEPRLHEHLPWGDVGLGQPGAFLIRSRQKVTVPGGGPVQIPLEAGWFTPGPGTAGAEALVKEALVVSPDLSSPGHIHVQCGLRKAVSLPATIDASVATGGILTTSADIADGGEVLITGLGPSPVVAAPVEEYVDPLERYRPHRLLSHHHHEDCLPVAPPMDIAVLMVVRLAPPRPN